MLKQIITLFVIATISAHVYAQPIGIKPIEPKEKKALKVGDKAPAFELKDQNGKTHKLSDYEDKIVVLEWFNDNCPYCKNVWNSGLVPKLVSALQEKEFVYLAINSTANKPEEDVLKSGIEFLKDVKSNIPMLMDYDGKTGRAYGARTTPHMFVIDEEGVLVYQGALSDDPRSKEGDKAETHIMRVVAQLEVGEKVSPSYVQPWGCSVKYKRDGKSGRKGRPRGGPRK